MDAIEKRVSELSAYLPDTTAQKDMDEFWRRSIAAARARPFNDSVKACETPLRAIEAYEVRFEGYDDTPLYAWYLLPPQRPE